jgi:hypothetical protein
LNNEISLKISSETIVGLLKDTNPEAYTFLYFLSLLPQGATGAELQRMWGLTHDKCCEVLSQFGVLEADEGGRHRVTPFMMNYAEQTIDKDSQ